MTEAKKLSLAPRSNGKQTLNIPYAAMGASSELSGIADSDNFAAELTGRLRMLSEASRLNAIIQIFAILNQFAGVEETQ